jgi:hypothetical protein
MSNTIHKTSGSTPGAGIFMPGPSIETVDQLKNGQTIPLNRPLNLFVPSHIDMGEVVKVAKKSPITAKRLSDAEVQDMLSHLGPGQTAPSGPGNWYRLQDKKGAKPGQKATINLVFYSMDPRGKSTTHVHVKVGDNIFFMAGVPAL